MSSRSTMSAIGFIAVVVLLAGSAGFFLGSPSTRVQAKSSDRENSADSSLISKKEWAGSFADGSASLSVPVANETSVLVANVRISPQEKRKIMDGLMFKTPSVQWYMHYFSAVYGIDPLLVQAVVRVESGFDPTVRSRKGAMGLMQINKVTAKHLGLKNPYDVRENLEGGIRYLKILLKRHSWDLELALASYNAGPATVKRYKGMPPFPETQEYVKKVIDEYRTQKTGQTAYIKSQSHPTHFDHVFDPSVMLPRDARRNLLAFYQRDEFRPKNLYTMYSPKSLMPRDAHSLGMMRSMKKGMNMAGNMSGMSMAGMNVADSMKNGGDIGVLASRNPNMPASQQMNMNSISNGSPAGKQAGMKPASRWRDQNVRLVGTLIGSMGVRNAIIEVVVSKEQNIYRIGDRIEGALIQNIDRIEVRLLYNGEVKILQAFNRVRSQTRADESPESEKIRIPLP